MKQSKIITQLIAGVAATMAALGMGFHIGWTAPSFPKLISKDSDIPITSGESSWIAGFLTIGGAIGPYIAAALVDRCGRKLSLLITVIPQLTAAVLIFAAQGFWWFIIARLFAGLVVGFTCAVMPMYLGEIADDRIRGALGTLTNIMLNVGIVTTYSVGPWVSRKALAALGGALALLFGLTFMWMPESPYFLVMKGKLDQAEKTLLWFRGKEHVDQELKRVRDSVEFELKNAGTLKELVMAPGNRKAMIVVLGVGLAQQFSGILAVLSYSSLIFQASGSSLDASISVIIIGGVQLLSGLLPLLVIDLAGRRPLLLLSTCGAALFLGGEAYYFQLQSNGSDMSALSWLPITAIIGFMICHAIGLACIPHVLISEMFPCNVKALATMITTSAMCATGFIVTIAYQDVVDKYGIHVSFWGFTGITLIWAIFIYAMVPETKQRSFLSIQAELNNASVRTTEEPARIDESMDTPDQNSKLLT